MDIPNLQITAAALDWFNKLLKRSSRGVVSEKVTITPERAAVLFSRNPDNRNLREAKITQLASDLTQGKFHFNGESIIIANDGYLNDGQHRLFACLKTGISFDTILVVGTERASRFSIDTGSAKSASDHLSVQGFQNTSTAAAMARAILSWEEDGTQARRNRISAQAQIERVQNDELLRDIAQWTDNHRGKLRALVKGSVTGFVYYLFASKAPQEATLFMEQFRTGAQLSDTSPIYLLREKLRYTDRLTDTQRIEAFVRAWNHWCNGPSTGISRLQLMGTIPAISTPKWTVSVSQNAPSAPEPAKTKTKSKVTA